MLKKKVSVCVFVLLIGLAIFCNVSLINVKGATTVNGLIAADTVWIKENSPYVLTDPINIPSGVTLTIEPGVTVDFGEYYLNVDGILHAVGTDSEKIVFSILGTQLVWTDASPGVIVFSNTTIDWNEPTHTGSIIENAVFVSTQT
ncbi:MAG: hypothetical protein GX638_12495, partial [Crenarchaeota archaeon]|nr:hypothetical protein [Thermoproteota archaeon]